MSNILCIETSTDICSIALDVGQEPLIVEEGQKQKSHAAEIILLIKKCLDKANLKWSDLSAVALSSGPGSFTGLRVGAATAKGICFAHQLPLIAVDTLRSMALSVVATGSSLNESLVLLHARKQEFYAQCHDQGGLTTRTLEVLDLSQTTLKTIVDPSKDFSIITDSVEVVAPFSDGHPIVHSVPHAKFLTKLAQSNFQKKVFVDLSNYTPMYVKAPYITTSKKSI